MKNGKKNYCCEKCGLIPDDAEELQSIQCWSGKLTLCRDCLEQYQQEKQDERALVEYICSKHKIKEPSPYIFKQIQDLLDQGFTYKMIRYFCYYSHNIAKNYKPEYCNSIANASFVLKSAIRFAEYNQINIDELDYN